jgi:putative ABC transport system ATP-binding protein
LTLFRRLRIGLVFQQFNLIATLTAAQNIALPATVDGRPGRWTRKRVAELLDLLQLTERAEHRPDALSGGEQQRVAIARALLFEPTVILADEPTGNLDSQSSERLWQLLHDLADQRQITVIMVTHEPAAVVHCRQVFVLGDGQVQGDFAAEGLDTVDVAARYQQLSR